MLLAGVFGAATGVGYFARLVEQTKTPDKTEMLAKINDIHGVSVINYSNGQAISDISSDLVRVTVKSDEISPNVKNALIATEDDSFKRIRGGSRRSCSWNSWFSRWWHKFWWFNPYPTVN